MVMIPMVDAVEADSGTLEVELPATPEPIEPADAFEPEIAEDACGEECDLERRETATTSTPDSPLRAAEHRIVEISLEMAEIEDRIDQDKSRLKELRKEMSEAAAELKGLREEGDWPEKIEEDSTPSRVASNDDTSRAVALSPQAPAADSAPVPPSPSFDPTQPDAWRAMPTTALPLESIKGLGAKKRDALLAAAPTIGELEDLRAAANGKGLHEVLPEGFGKKISGELENRLIDWLTVNRDGMEFSKGRGESERDLEDAAAEREERGGGYDPDAGLRESGELIEEDAESDSHSPASPDGPPDEPQPDPFTDPEFAAELAQKQSRLAELAAIDPRPDPLYGLIFDDGKSAARNGGSIADCGWIPGDQQDSWLLGWLAESERIATEESAA